MFLSWVSIDRESLFLQHPDLVPLSENSEAPFLLSIFVLTWEWSNLVHSLLG